MWKLICGSALATVAVLVVAVAVRTRNESNLDVVERGGMASAVFFSILLLHWLTWRFIVPSTSYLPVGLTAFMPSREKRQTFLSGTIGFGYCQVMLYCVDYSGVLAKPFPGNRLGLLYMGMLLIALGTAGRLRVVFSELASLLPVPSKNHTGLK